jgi:hypothetical protein
LCGESRTARSPTPDESIEIKLGAQKLPGWVLLVHFPKFKIRSDPLKPSPSQHVSFHPFTDVEVMETFKDPRLLKSRLEDLHPSVFDNPAYKISDGKWLEHITHGNPSVRQYCHIFNDLRVRLLVFFFRFPATLNPPETPNNPNHPIFTPPNPKPECPVFVSRSLDLPDPVVRMSSF